MKSKKYRKILILALLVPVFLFLGCSPKNPPPLAREGVLDLRDLDFQNSVSNSLSGSITSGGATINLDGEWEFRWKDITAPGGKVISSKEEKVEYISVPGKWNGGSFYFKDGDGWREEVLGGEGHATYKLKILLRERIPLSLRIPDEGTSYRVYVDEDFLIENGRVGISSESTEPDKSTSYVSFLPVKKDFNLLVQISNYSFSRGGFWQSISMASPEVQNAERLNRVALDLFVTGILFIMGVYHMALFTLRKEDRAPLYFGSFCLLFSIRILLTGEVYLKILLPKISYVPMIKLEYLTMYMGLPIFNEFISALYPGEIIQNIRKTISGLGIIYSSIVLFLSPKIFSITLISYQIVILFSIIYILVVFIRAVRNNREGARTILLGFFLFGLSIINDILLNHHIISSIYYTPYGLVIFIFSQSYLLTSRFANSYKQVRELSQNLENKVRERTDSLEIANSEILKSKQETDSLNDLIRTINSVSSLTDVMTYVMFFLEMNYSYNTFWLLLYDGEEDCFKSALCVSTTLSPDKTLQVQNATVKVEKGSSLQLVMETQKPVLQENTSNLDEPDGKIFSMTGLTYHFYLPFFIYGECIGILTLHKLEHTEISDEEKEKISIFTDMIAGAVYNSLLFSESQKANELLEIQKGQMEKAYSELKEMQEQLVEAERMASLGQLVGGIAHEINNPIAVVQSQVKLLEYNRSATFKEIPLFLDSLENNEKVLFFEIVENALNNRSFLNTKEERTLKKKILSNLDRFKMDENTRISLAEKLVNLRYMPPYDEIFQKLEPVILLKFLTMASLYKSQSNSIGNIETAVEKVSRIVFALKNYLSTQGLYEKKNVDLVEEIEKALKVYDNYIVGKIHLIKDFPLKLKYYCTSENLIQVWKNIIFNSIQAMYDTEKKFEIKIEIFKEFPEELFLYQNSDPKKDLQQDTGWILIRFIDSGIGIPEEIKEKIFSPFFTTKSTGEGIGLGLYTSKKIIHDNNGAIYFQSKKDRTEFIIVLPEQE